ncbi:lambda exonuclease family protein [Haliscomenobacter sp.]|uniref:lambda exonuclease family protein n=1 Tax=Haliscomenobacter sp. TaxID=2717303 RepID=UPI0035938B11
MIKQRTNEWFRARIGKFTASNFSSIVSKPADKTASISKSAMNCIEKAAAQLFYNDYYERRDTDATRWGNTLEKEAIIKFAKKTNLTTKESGFILHPQFPDIGATPDVIIEDSNFPGKAIVAQIKCPFNVENHISYTTKIHDTHTLRSKKSEYFWQVQGEIWISDSIHGYFVSYSPSVSLENQLHIVEIPRDEVAIAFLKMKVFEAINIRNVILDEFNSGKRRPKPLESYW